jgi:hypothetical protein
MATTDYTLILSIVYDNDTIDIDLSKHVAAITPSYQRRNVKTITAIDGTEYSFPMPRKHHLKVDFKPMRGADLFALYSFLERNPWTVWYRVKYRDATVGGDYIITVEKMRVANEFETKFLLRTADTNRYYAGFTLELREQ